MDFSLSEEQKLLQDSVDAFIASEYDFERHRAIAASDDGFSREVWAQFAELGWLAIAVPEEFGGFGGTNLDLAILMEGLGRGLLCEPFLPTAVLGARTLALGGSEEQQREWLPRLAEGNLLLAFAHTEPRSRFDLGHVETTARKDGDGYVLDGHKSVAFHAGAADRIVVSARTAEGVTLFLVDPRANGVDVHAYATIDARRAAELTFDGARVDGSDVIGEVDGALPLIECVVDYGITAICAEAVGAMHALVTATPEYLRERHQFGVPLATFQVLQHRSVDMYIEYELSKSTARRAAVAVEDAVEDGDPVARAKAASTAKVQIGRAGKLVGQQAVQLHGGMGMADELPIGHYFKRLSLIDSLFGDVDHHLRRFARLTLEA